MLASYIYVSRFIRIFASRSRNISSLEFTSLFHLHLFVPCLFLTMQSKSFLTTRKKAIFIFIDRKNHKKLNNFSIRRHISQYVQKHQPR